MEQVEKDGLTVLERYYEELIRDRESVEKLTNDENVALKKKVTELEKDAQDLKEVVETLKKDVEDLQ